MDVNGFKHDLQHSKDGSKKKKFNKKKCKPKLPYKMNNKQALSTSTKPSKQHNSDPQSRESPPTPKPLDYRSESKRRAADTDSTNPKTAENPPITRNEESSKKNEYGDQEPSSSQLGGLIFSASFCLY